MTERPAGHERGAGRGRGASRAHGAGRGRGARRERRAAPNSRAAILAVVLAAVALSLAYPVREYITQRRQIEQLRLQAQHISQQIRRLETQQVRLRDPAYIEQQARDRLHLCFPTQTCYVIIGPGSGHRTKAISSGMPWYARLWSSVQQANGGQASRLARAAGG